MNHLGRSEADSALRWVTCSSSYVKCEYLVKKSTPRIHSQSQCNAPNEVIPVHIYLPSSYLTGVMGSKSRTQSRYNVSNKHVISIIFENRAESSPADVTTWLAD
jgi:hypothetical protein